MYANNRRGCNCISIEYYHLMFLYSWNKNKLKRCEYIKVNVVLIREKKKKINENDNKFYFVALNRIIFESFELSNTKFQYFCWFYTFCFDFLTLFFHFLISMLSLTNVQAFNISSPFYVYFVFLLLT